MTLEELQRELIDLYRNDTTVNAVFQHAITNGMTTEQALIWMVKELAKAKKHYVDEVVKMKMNSTTPVLDIAAILAKGE